MKLNFTLKSILRSGSALALALMISVPVFAQDSVVTREGKRIPGTILSESAEFILIQTDYGDLRFRKIHLSQIERNGQMQSLSTRTRPPAAQATQPTPTPEPTPSGFGAPTSQGFASPTTLGFGQQQPAQSQQQSPPGFGPSPSGSANPFGMPAQGDPPGQQASQQRQQPTQSFGVTQEEEPYAIPRQAVIPRPQPGFAALVWDLFEDHNGFVRPAENTPWQLKAENTPIQEGWQVRSLDDKKLRVTFAGPGDVLGLQPNSVFTFSNFSGNGENIEIFLTRGTGWFETKDRLQGSFTVRTPEMTAQSLDSSLFEVRYLAGLGSQISVARGEVILNTRDTAQRLTVESGNSVVLNNRGQILTKTSSSAAIVEKWSDWENWRRYGVDEQIVAQVLQSQSDWQEQIAVYRQSGNLNSYRRELETLSAAFMQFARDTGIIPSEEEAWTSLRFNTGIEGWNGPYLLGAIPPADPWGRPVIYRNHVNPNTGNTFGQVYSVWTDGVDAGGTDGRDFGTVVLYPQIPNLRAPGS